MSFFIKCRELWLSAVAAFQGMRPVKKTLVVFALLACISATGLHGFSIGAWAPYVNAADKIGTHLFGSHRPIRSDDWLVHLSFIKAQIEHRPPFPVENTLIFDGQNMLPLEVPVSHPVALFRPTTWGFFVGFDFGLAWMWWSRVLWIALGMYYSCRVLCGASRAVAGLAGLLLLFTPFVQFWSLNNAVVIGSSLFVAIFFAGLAAATTLKSAVLRGLALGWAGGCLALVLYPPYQVTFGFTCLASLVAVGIVRRSDFLWKLTFCGLAAATIVAGTAVGSFVSSAMPAIERITNTVYPGARFMTGGTVSFDRLVQSTFFLDRKVSNWGPFGNICEGAAMAALLILAVIAAPLIVYYKSWCHQQNGEPLREDLRAKRLALGVLIVHAVISLFMLLFMLIGFPDWLARASFMFMVLPQRASGAFGVSGILAAVAAFQLLPGWQELSFRQGGTLRMIWTVAGCLALIALLIAFGETTSTKLGVPPKYFWLSIGLWGFVCILYLKRNALAFGLLAAAAVWATSFFNPLTLGSDGFPQSTKLGSALAPYRGEQGGWAVVDRHEMHSVLRMLGLKTFGGVSFEPQLAFFQQLLPNNGKDSEQIFNRFAHIGVRLSNDGQNRVQLVAPDAFEYFVPMENLRQLQTLGVRFLLIPASSPFAGALALEAKVTLLRQTPEWLVADLGAQIELGR